MLPTPNQWKTIAFTVLVLAGMYRVDATRDFLTGDRKFLGLF